MAGYILVTEFKGQREIGEWRVRPFPFITRIQHAELEKAGVESIVCRSSLRTPTIRVTVNGSAWLPELERRLAFVAEIAPNSIFGYTHSQGRRFWFPTVSLDQASRDQWGSKWLTTAQEYAATLWIEKKIAEQVQFQIKSFPSEGQVDILKQADIYLKVLKEVSSSPPTVSGSELAELVKFILDLPGLAIIYRLK